MTPPTAVGGGTSLLDRCTEGLRIIAGGATASTAQTPRDVVWTKNKATLYRYVSDTAPKHPVPILLVYALVGRSYVFDLMPGNSFVEFLVSEGFDVYLLDWGIPGPEDRDLALDDYVLDYLPRAVKKVLRSSGTEQLTLFGYCQGGVMSAMYAALMPEHLRNLVLLTTPVDFTPGTTGLPGLWLKKEHHDPDVVVNAYGNVPAKKSLLGTAMQKPLPNYVGTYVTMWNLLLRDKPMDGWRALSKWANDSIPVAGAAYRQWVEDFHRGNRLAQGEMRLRGRRVDLSTISVPLLNIAGHKDHLCLFSQAEATMDLVSSQDKTLLALDAGHVGLLVGRGARNGMWPETSAWLAARSSDETPALPHRTRRTPS